jgi:hypothetical protein
MFRKTGEGIVSGLAFRNQFKKAGWDLPSFLAFGNA